MELATWGDLEVAVRDSVFPDQVITFGRAALTAFVSGVRNAELGGRPS
ncbi:DUF397 domain-containing protein [Streptomyces sp. G-G2]|nr:DUF397 domain-containing protein [Streptomyces sp. G-G2]MDJ0379487.1 DUF397 domain-containing protein [Streptomyces sp. G-G2]